MHMSYWFGTKVGDLLFQGFTISSLSGFICTCLGIVSLAVLFDALKLALLSTKQRAADLTQVNAHGVPCSSEASLLLDHRSNSTLRSNVMKCLTNFGELILFTTHEIVSYLLMLIVMTYNGYFTIATVLGAGLGFFIFSPALIEATIRRSANAHSRMFCSKCIEKSKDTTENDSQSETLRQTAEGMAEVVADSFNSSSNQDVVRTTSEEPRQSTEVAIVHSTNEEIC